MCGRYTITKKKEQVNQRFNAIIDDSFSPNYNIAPSTILPIITNKNEKKIQYYKWGLIPYWNKKDYPIYSMINAREETIFEKPTFKLPIKKQRCLIIADGYYEWLNTDQGKQAYYIYYNDNRLFAFAGIWDAWNKKEEKIYSFSILTKKSQGEISNIHHRMPVILNREHEREWIADIKEPQIRDIIKSSSEKNLTYHSVSKRVNSARNNDKTLINSI